MTKSHAQWALLIGIDDYSQRSAGVKRLDASKSTMSFNSLNGCVEDVLQVERYFADTLRVPSGNITMLLSPRPADQYLLTDGVSPPTYANIIEAFSTLSKKAQPGDSVYIHYSGHGARTTSVFPELKKGQEPIDDALVPCDIQAGGKFLRGPELGMLLQRLVKKELRVTMVLDCCHSASATRGSEHVQERAIPGVYQSVIPDDVPDSKEEILASFGYDPNDIIAKSLGDTGNLDPRGYTLLAACQGHETAKEYTVDSTRTQGALTYWLLDTLRTHPGTSVSPQALYRRLCAKIRSNVKDQTPNLTGASDSIFFSLNIDPPIPSISVESVNGTGQVGDTVELVGGRMHGVLVGAEYNVFPYTLDTQTLKLEKDTTRIGRLKIEKVGAGESTGRIIEIRQGAAAAIEPGSHAILFRLPADEKSLVKFKSPGAESFKMALDQHPKCSRYLELVPSDDRRQAKYHVSINKDNEYEIRDSHDELWPRLNYIVSPLRTDHLAASWKLMERLRHLAEFSMVESLENPNPGSYLKNAVTFEALESKTLKPLKEVNGEFHVKDGEKIQLRINNTSRWPLHVVLFDLTPRYGVSQIFPKPKIEYSYCLNPQTEISRACGFSIPEKLKPHAATGEPMVDILRLFVTDQPINLTALTTEPIDVREQNNFRAGDQSTNALQGLLGKLAVPRRDADMEDDEDAEFENWQIIDLHVKTLPNTVNN